MFSIEIKIQRRRFPRRVMYASAAAAAALLFAGIAYALPGLDVSNRWLREVPTREVALWMGSTLCLFAALAAIIAYRWRTNVVGHNSLQSIHRLSPREFNRLVEEGFRGQGYLVQTSERLFSRAGIDLILRKADKHILVLCRRDPEPARQMAAVQELHAATATLQEASGLLITCEMIAPEVKVFAAQQGIAVIEGPALLKLLQRAHGTQPERTLRREPHFATPLTELPVCATCGGPMVPGSDHEHDPDQRSWYCSRGEECRMPRLA